jgi:hypothetical protein
VRGEAGVCIGREYWTWRGRRTCGTNSWEREVHWQLSRVRARLRSCTIIIGIDVVVRPEPDRCRIQVFAFLPFDVVVRPEQDRCRVQVFEFLPSCRTKHTIKPTFSFALMSTNTMYPLQLVSVGCSFVHSPLF